MAKLHADSVLLQVVRHQLKLLWSPQKIARKLRLLWPDNPEKTVSHETIYNAIYLHPRGELKRELIACPRHHKQVRKPRSRGTDRRGQIPEMLSIHIRPPVIEDRLIPGCKESSLLQIVAADILQTLTLYDTDTLLVIDSFFQIDIPEGKRPAWSMSGSGY